MRPAFQLILPPSNNISLNTNIIPNIPQTRGNFRPANIIDPQHTTIIPNIPLSRGDFIPDRSVLSNEVSDNLIPNIPESRGDFIPNRSLFNTITSRPITALNQQIPTRPEFQPDTSFMAGM